MKKLICCILTAAMLLTIGVVAYATEVTTCTVAADSVRAGGGEEVTVPIRIRDNPGFTNFSIRLSYDPEALTLKALENVAGEVSSVNPAGKDADGNVCAIVVSASGTAVTEDCVLFNAVFTVHADFSGTTEITPVVNYIRNNSAVFSLFEEINATVESGTLTVEDSFILGDVTGDGRINMGDMQTIYNAATGKLILTEAQTKAADVSGDGEVTMRDMQLVYQYCTGKITEFPAG